MEEGCPQHMASYNSPKIYKVLKYKVFSVSYSYVEVLKYKILSVSYSYVICSIKI